jgi:phenylalanyl-tRNA synthetase beta chain
MKVPLTWLRELVPCGMPVAQLAERLTIAGLEVAGIRSYGLPSPEGVTFKADDQGPVWLRDKVVVARVIKTEKHPNADKLKLVTVDYGASETKVVVTGAPNINIGDSGQKVILGLSGTHYFDGHATPKTIKELKPSVLRGIPSDAMVMSEFELGITDEHEGIIILDGDAPVGMPLADYFGDVVLEIDVLPNMARCLSMIGVAREVAALSGNRVQLPDVTCPRYYETISGQVSVAIEDSALSARYLAMLIGGVTIGPSPQWLRQRLTYSGMRPINNIVDITNYVMLEWGQPLHAFDYDVLQHRAKGNPPTITVRSARPGEKLVTLDKVERTLSPDMLVIADVAGPIALAGVMGGLETEVTPATRNILLESASFNYVSIRRTMRALNLPSEASARFSRGVHPEIVRPAAQRAAQLMHRIAGGTVCEGEVDCYPAPPQIQRISLPLSEVRRVLGVDIAREEVSRILQALEFQVTNATNENLDVIVPPHRLDVQEGAADLIEEIARIHGYDKLPATMLAEPLPEQKGNPELIIEDSVRDHLAEAGLQEVVTYSLIAPERESPLAGEDAPYVRLQNPISADRAAMRRTLLGGVLDVARSNLDTQSILRLFEIGRVYLPGAEARLPEERLRLAIVLTGRRDVDFWGDSGTDQRRDVDFFDLKGGVESLIASLHLEETSFVRATVPWLHPGQSAALHVGGQAAGYLGMLHPRVAPKLGLGNRVILAAELDLGTMIAAVPSRYRYRIVSRYPAALRDVAIIVAEEMTADRVLHELQAAGGELLRNARLFDVYRGPSIPAGTKSLAFALTYQAHDRTLTDKEVDKAHRSIEERLKRSLKAQIRGKE